MSSESDNIEAKLAAYIDGQLPEEERAEIERYLANNPQQAQVMQDLMQGRQLLQSLPRESAPAEVMETIQSSLERGQLLARPVEEEAATRTGWWRQSMAIAALLLLAVGLAGLVYWVTHPPGIPKYSTAEMMPTKPMPATEDVVNTGAASRDSNETVAPAVTNGPVTSAPAEGLLADGKRGGGAAGFGVALSDASTVDRNPAVAAAPSAPGASGQEAGALALNGGANALTQNAGQQNAFVQNLLTQNANSQSAYAQNAPAQTVVVTRDVERARVQATEYFARNNIAYEFSAMPQNANGQANSQAGGGALNSANSALAFQGRLQSQVAAQNQMIVARRVPADKVTEITRAISGKPLVMKTLDESQVQPQFRRALGSNVRQRDQAATEAASGLATQNAATAPALNATGRAAVNASQPSNEDVDLTIVFSPEEAQLLGAQPQAAGAGAATQPVEAPVLVQEKAEEVGKDATSKPAPPVWLKTKAGIQYEK